MRRERGVALITALLVVAIATTAAVAMAARQQLDIRRTGNVLDSEQAYLYAFGVEDWAAQVLRRDREDNDFDHPGEDWATRLPPMPVEGGQLTGRLTDLQARFNLNNLVDNDGKASPEDVKQFRNLLAAVGLNFELADTVVDWLDQDLDPRIPAGAEDPAYLDRSPAYRAANRPMADASELRLVAGFNEPPPSEMTTRCTEAERPAPTVYDVIAACVTALPERTPVNVNTATLPVLMSLHDQLTEADAQALMDARGDEGFETIDYFNSETHGVLAGRPPVKEITVKSRYFGLEANIAMGRVTLRMRSTLVRSDKTGETHVAQRAQDTF